MRVRIVSIAMLAALVIASPALVAAQPKEMFIPLLVYRTGPYAPSGIPIADGFVDYFTLLTERDGGINGVKVVWEECETQYDNKQGVECYERLKGKSPVLVNPYSTAITYSLIPKAPVDKVVVFSMGYGMSAASDGRWFPWVFNFPTNYWSQASAVIRYIGQQEGGVEKLKGKKIAHIFHNSVYGKGKGTGRKEDIGAPLYNRGVVNAMLSAEAIRTAMTKFGNRPLTGEQVRWGFENLNLTEQRLEQVGMKGFTHPVRVTCEDHEGSGPVLIQQWDGKKWNVVSDWIAPMRDVVRPKIEAAAVEESKKLGYTMRDCAKEK